MVIPDSVRDFHVDVPDFFNWGFDVVRKQAETNPRKKALVYTDDEERIETYTFKDIEDNSNQLANAWAGGLEKDDAVMLMLPNIPPLWTSLVALIKMGVVIVPSAPNLTQKDLDYRVMASNIKGIITDSKNTTKFDDIVKAHPKLSNFLWVVRGYDDRSIVESKNDKWTDLADASTQPRTFDPSRRTKAEERLLIYFTSGTEGPPKMVVHTHASYPLGHMATATWLGLRGEYLHWNISSPGWAKFAWSSIFAPWNLGAATFAYNYKGRFVASKHLEKISEFGVNSLCAAPTIWRMIILEDLDRFDFSGLKQVTSAGEPLNPEVIARFAKATGLTIRDGYGQTETVVQAANFPGLSVKPGSMGIACPLYDLSIVDESGNVLPEGKEGYIAIRLGPRRPFAMFSEYANDPERNTEAFRTGWYYTGDTGYKDGDGYFWYVGRADDVIKSSGYRIGPFEIESALIRHGAVAESAAVASPDPLRGAIVKCYVVLKAGYTPSPELAQELSSFVARETAPYKHPRKIEFVNSLDEFKTVSGKIRRRDLKLNEDKGERKRSLGPEYGVRPMSGA